MAFDLTVGRDYVFDVFGTAESKPIQNTFHYRCTSLPAPVDDSDDALLAFRAMWRTVPIGTLLASTYEVLAYRITRLAGVSALGVDERHNLRIDRDSILLGAGAADTGQSVGPPNATFVAAGVTKKTQELEVGSPFVLLGALRPGEDFRVTGGNRLGPIPENATDAPSGNDFNAAFLGALDDLCDDLKEDLVMAGGGNLTPQVVSLFYAKTNRTIDVGVTQVRVYARGLVLDVVNGIRASSQVSRKVLGGGGF